MAPEMIQIPRFHIQPKVLKLNQKGQALIESLFVLTWSAPLTFSLIKFGLHLLAVINLEINAENYFVCELAKKNNCQAKLEQSLRNNHFRTASVIHKNQGDIEQLEIQVSRKLIKTEYITVTRTFNFEKFRQEF